MNHTKCLGEVCRVVPGFAFKSTQLGEAGIPVVKIGSISEAGNVDLFNGQFLPPELLEDRHRKYFLRHGDIVMAMTGEGKVGRITDQQESLLNQRVCKLDPIDEADRAYLWVVVKSMDYSRLFAQLAQGAAQANISGSQIESLSIEWPGPAVRRRIADTALAYDDLIENNRRRIALLEQSVRLLYREWFAHLRFPGHEHVKVVDGVPEGWAIFAVSEVADLYRGISYSSDQLVEDGGKPFVNLKCINRFGGFRVSGVKRFLGEHKSQHVVKAGDIVLAVTDMTRDAMIVAQAAIVPKIVGDDAVFSMDMVKLVPKPAFASHWFHALLRFSSFSLEVREKATGATVLHLRPKHIEEWRTPVPPPALRDEYAEYVSPMYALMDELELQNEKLRQARDLLLPRLMSGELAV